MDCNKINLDIKDFDELRNNPIYSMSLGSKELFHSNFWAWLFDHNINYAKVFFKEIGEDYQVFRESKNRDIVIQSNNKEYIIENKLKSVPRYDQLVKYEEASNNFAKGILTGIIPPLFKKDNWEFKSYEKIIEEFNNINNDPIKSELKDIEDQKQVKIIISKYIESLNYINKIIGAFEEIEEIPNTIEDNKKDIDFIEQLKDLRIWDLYQKRKASEFLIYFNKDGFVEDFNKKMPEGFGFYTWVSYNRGKATIDFRILNHKDKTDIYVKKDICIGVQIEGPQFRRIVKIDENTLKEDLGCKNSKYNDFILNKFIDLKWLTTKENIANTSMRNEYCKYGDHEIYQYHNIEDYSFEKITKEVKEELRNLYNILKESNIVNQLKKS